MKKNSPVSVEYQKRCTQKKIGSVFLPNVVYARVLVVAHSESNNVYIAKLRCADTYVKKVKCAMPHECRRGAHLPSLGHESVGG